MGRSGWRVGLVVALSLAGLVGQQVMRTPVARAAAGSTWFVSPTGTDPGSCPSSFNFSHPFKTIAAALNCAAADAAPATNPDTIYLVTTAYQTPFAGGFTINQNVNLVGEAPARSWDAVDVTGGNPVITVAAGMTVTINGLHISGGNAPSGDGSGIHNHGTLTVIGSRITGNSSANGGGIDNDGGTLTVVDSDIGGNTASSNGGGIYNNGGTLTVTGSSIGVKTVMSGTSALNETKNTATGFGGGVWTNGAASITNTTMNGNSAGNVAGVDVESATATVTGSTISGNTSSGGDGGISVSLGTLTLVNDTIKGNSTGASGGAGGIGNSSGTLTVTNSTVSGNSAGSVGGGGIASTGTTSLTNDTIVQNSATAPGPGGGVAILSGLGTVTPTNTILAQNIQVNGATRTPSDCSGTLTDSGGGHNFLGAGGTGSTCTGLSSAKGDQIGTVGSPLDPKLGSLGSNGGTDQTLAPQQGSPVIGAGDTTTCQATGAAGVNDRDQRGNPRRTASRSACDIGAYDTASGPAVTWHVANGGADAACSTDTSVHPFLTVAHALDCAGFGDTISVAAGFLDMAPLIVSKSVNLVGGGAAYLNPSLGIGPTLTIPAGNTVSISGFATLFGGSDGAVVNRGNLTVTNSAIQASHGTGDIYNEGTLSVARSTLSSNAFAFGLSNFGAATVVSSTISQNFGGIDNETTSGGLTLTNSTMSGNGVGGNGFAGTTDGGGIWNNAPATLTNDTISGNKATTYGGGVAGLTSVVISNTIIAGNTISPTGSYGPDCSYTLTDGPGGHNLIGNNSSAIPCGLTNGANGDQVGTAANPIDPKLDVLMDNGGPTQTMALLANSPAIGKGDGATCRSTGATGVNDQDQRGAPRNSLARGSCDIGPYDTARQPVTWFVSLTGSNPASCPTAANTSNTPFLTISFALSCAFRGDTISLAPTGNGAYAGGVTISKNVNVVGPAGPSSTTISSAKASSATATAAPRVFYVNQYVTATISGVTITGAIQNNYGGGIEINFNTTLTVSNCVITGNTAPYGAGIADLLGSLTVINSTITNNSYTQPGGLGAGIYAFGSPGGTVTVINSTIANNSLTGATSQGAGLYDYDATFTLTNATVARNSATAGGGGIYESGPSPFTLTNTILAGNTSSSGGADCDGTQPELKDGTGGHNLLGDNTNCSGLANGTNGDQVGTGGSPLDPGLDALTDNGGPTPTIGLVPGSPAIGKADPTTCKNGPVSDVDQRGLPRRTATRGVCDIGAYDTEGLSSVIWHVSPTGTDTACNTDTSFSPFLTVAHAESCARLGDTISLAASAGSTPYAGGVTLNKATSLTGAGAGMTTISGGGPVLTVGSYHHLAINGLTITGGNTTGEGGGILNNGVLALTSSVVRNNQATSYGGGIRSYGPLTVNSSTVSQNHTEANGGGIDFTAGSGTVTNSTIDDNTSSSNGAGIGINTNVPVSLTNTTLSGNTAGGGGGAVLNFFGTLTATNTTISGNHASTGFAGGIWSSSSTATAHVTLTNTILAGNTAVTGGPDCDGTQPELKDGAGAHNLLGNSTNCTGLSGTGDQVGSGTAPLNPGLGPLADNGGPTQTMAVTYRSPALLAGDPTTCKALVGPDGITMDVDQRGNQRNTVTRSGCDIGSFDTGAVKQGLSARQGWTMVGGSPLSLWADASTIWTWSALNGQWSHPTGAEPPGSGAWEELGTANSEQLTVQLCTSGVAVSVAVQPHRWNMVGNPCNRTVQLPADARALAWNGSTYVLTQSIPAGQAVWVLPTSSPLVLTPV